MRRQLLPTHAPRYAALCCAVQGVLRMGQEIEVRPGIVTKDASGAIKCIPIFSRIVSLFAEQNELQYAVPGGLIGVGTTVDPTLTRADRLVGQVRRARGSGWGGGARACGGGCPRGLHLLGRLGARSFACSGRCASDVHGRPPGAQLPAALWICLRLRRLSPPLSPLPPVAGAGRGGRAAGRVHRAGGQLLPAASPAGRADHGATQRSAGQRPAADRLIP